MIGAKQLIKLQAYASGVNENIKVYFEPGTNRVLVDYSDKRYIGLANKPSSALTQTTVREYIDMCNKSHK